MQRAEFRELFKIASILKDTTAVSPNRLPFFIQSSNGFMEIPLKNIVLIHDVIYNFFFFLLCTLSTYNIHIFTLLRYSVSLI